MPPHTHLTTLARALVVASILAGCGGSQVSTILSTIGDGPSIVADELTFDRSVIVIPADRAVGLPFENRESAPHNLAIYTDESAGGALFVGEIFSGPGSRTYQLPAFAAGTYHFRCDVHPEMRGELVATP